LIQAAQYPPDYFTEQRFADLFGRPVRRTVQPHFQGSARGDDSHGHRRYTVRVHFAVDNAPVLEGPAHVSEVQIHVGERDTAHGHAPQKGTERIR